MTNGQRFEAWQLQPTTESEKIIDLAVADLIANRGKLESLLSKKSLVSLCVRLSVKTFVKFAAQHKEYVSAESARISKDKNCINRTLRYRAADKYQVSLPSDQLINTSPAGAIILAPSGFGKSTLSHQILRQALERRSIDNEAPLPFLVPLPAIGRDTGSLLRFMQLRLAAYSPGETFDSLREMLRASGAIIVCDAFDRVAAPFRAQVQSELSNVIRDFPLVQLIVFSRESARPDMALPSFNLVAPSDEELRNLEFLVLGQRSAFVSSRMPKTLLNICENILVARLVFEYWKENREYPLQLGLLFRAWLDSLLQTSPSGAAIWQESALTLLAEASVNAPIQAAAAAALLKQNHIDPSVIDELIERDALSVNGGSLELQHEVLADYLRARQLASAPEPVLIDKLSTIEVSKDSLFPTLLMSQLRSRQLQSAFWRRLSETSFDVYLDALRYRFDLTEEMGKLGEEKLSREYLEDLLDGIEIPLDAFFPAMHKAVASYLTLEEESRPGIVGIVHGPPADQVAYGFRAIVNENRITIGTPSVGTPGSPDSEHNLCKISWLNLGPSGYRLDSGRLVGATILRDALLESIENQEIEGDAAWKSERLVGRIWHLQRSYHLAISERDSLEALDKELRPYAGKKCAHGDSQRVWFSIDSMLRDIAFLAPWVRSGLICGGRSAAGYLESAPKPTA